MDLISILQNILKIAKSSKCDYVYCTEHGMICSNAGWDFITTIDFVSPIYFSFVVSSLKNFLASTEPTDKIEITDSYIINQTKQIYIEINNELLKYGLVDKYNKVCNIISVNPTSIADLSSNDQFNKINDGKTKDGAGRLVINNHVVFLYSGLLPTNKKDKVDLSIWDINDSYFLNGYRIKKGKLNYTVYVMYLNVA